MTEPVAAPDALASAIGPDAIVEGSTVHLTLRSRAASGGGRSAAVEAHGGRVHDLVMAEPTSIP